MATASVLLTGPAVAEPAEPDEATKWFQRAIALDNEGRRKSALRAYGQVLALNPEHGRALINLALLEIETGKVDAAIKRCHFALELAADGDNPKNAAKAHYCLGLAELARGRLAEAEAALVKAHELLPDAPLVNVELGHLRRKDGKIEAALEHYRQAVRLAPDDADLHVHLGYCHKALGDLPAAAVEYRKAIQKDPKSYYGHLNLGVVLVRLEKHEEAERMYAAASALRPSASEPHYNLGNLHARAGRLVPARDAYELAVHHSQKNAGYRLALAKVQWQLGKPEDARSTLAVAGGLDPTESERRSIDRLSRQLDDNPAPPKKVRLPAATPPRPRAPPRGGRNQPE